jgi:DNA-binding transcriptional regulator YiaG
MSRNSWLPEGLERLGRTHIAPRVQSGSPVGLLLTWAGDMRDIKTIPAILALFRRDMVLLRAKRAIEAMVTERRVFVLVPKVESLAALTQELAEAGVRAIALPDAAVDVGAIRDKLGLTQEQFAVRYGLDVDAVRNWERGRRTPDTAAQSYLRAIDAEPEVVEAALWGQGAERGR